MTETFQVIMGECKKAKVIGVIPARYASSRFPGKLLHPLFEKPVLYWTIERARACKVLDDLYIATDDQRIYDYCLSIDTKVIMTSQSCLSGTHRLFEAYQLTPEIRNADILVNIQGDEPLIEPAIIEKAVEALLKTNDAVCATCIYPLTSLDELENLSVVKCVRNQKGDALYFSRAPIPANKNPQTILPSDCYRHIGLYAYRADFLPVYENLADTPLQKIEDLEQLKILEHGFCIKTVVVESQSIGVDTPADLEAIKNRLQKTCL